MRRLLTAVAAVSLLVGVSAAGYWAGTNAVVPPGLPAASHATQTYIAATGTVGRSLKVGVTAAWTSTRTIFGSADGVVTAVRQKPGALANAGDVIATVELRPVVIAAGRVPMFRTLARDVHGPDVRQFQEMLRTTGFLKTNATGRFDRPTIAAARRWQRSLGVKQDGIVRAGDLLFIDRLPARLVVVPAVGVRTAAGAEFVHVLGASPTFMTSITGSTRAELTSGMTVEITAPDGFTTWMGTLGPFVATEDGRFTASISGTLCGTACDAVAVNGATALSGTVALVPEESGVVVPVSALTQTASGGAAVSLADGTKRTVRVAAQADGFAIVDGLEAGTTILLPAQPAP